jgi:hypothetical protein
VATFQQFTDMNSNPIHDHKARALLCTGPVNPRKPRLASEETIHGSLVGNNGRISKILRLPFDGNAAPSINVDGGEDDS